VTTLNFIIKGRHILGLSL